jgi:Undecaprenyl-phosphate galactose phosphotransferase WbaP
MKTKSPIKLLWIVSLLFFDISAFYSAVFLNHFISDRSIYFILTNPLPLITGTFPLLAFLIPTIAYQGLYTKRLPLNDEIRRVVKVVLFMILIVILLLISQQKGEKWLILSSIQLGFFIILFLSVYRTFGKRLLYSSGIGKEKVMILGAGNAGALVLKGLKNERHMGYDVIGFLDDDKNKKGQRIDNVKIFGETRHLTKFLNKLEIDTVIIAITALPVEKIVRITNSIQKLTKKILLIPDLKGIALFNTELYHLFMQQIFMLDIRNNLKSTANRIVKRIFDIVASILLLPFLLFLIIVIAILIKLDSPGVVFFSQERMGKNKSIFKCLKFRTMHIDSDKILDEYLKNNSSLSEEWTKYKKLRGYDPRVTKVGRLLRKLSIDELPQIFHVLRGEMSLVGPRPYLPREKNEMKDYIDTILMTTPGITGLWQISGRNNLGFGDRLNLDSWYVLNWSLWLDIVILFKTVKVVLKGEGAY